MFLPKIKVAPGSATEILSVSELKSSLRISHSSEDALLERFINASVARVDGYYGVLGKALLTQTWQIQVEELCSRIFLPFGNNTTEATVKYYDSDNVLQIAAGTLYSFNDTVRGPTIELLYNQQWPQTYTRSDAALVEWTIGYGTSADIPPAIKEAIALLASNFYENRAVTDIQSFKDLPPAAQALLSPYSSIGI